MTFVTCVYNKEYLNLLGALIESVDRVYKESTSFHIYYNSIPEEWVDKTSIAYPRVSLIPYNPEYDLQDKITKRISRKINFWYYAIQNIQDNNIVLLDSDMVVYKSINKYFEEDFDVGYTFKTNEDENLNWIINAGLILVKNRNKSLSFFEWWKNKVNYILSDQDLDNIAGRDWGAADQAALGGHLNIKQYTDCFKDAIVDGCHFKGFKCCELNETRCMPFNNDLHIIHFKGKWHSVLVSKEFNQWRPKEKCLEMYTFWNDLYNTFNIKCEIGKDK